MQEFKARRRAEPVCPITRRIAWALAGLSFAAGFVFAALALIVYSVLS